MRKSMSNNPRRSVNRPGLRPWQKQMNATSHFVAVMRDVPRNPASK